MPLAHGGERFRRRGIRRGEHIRRICHIFAEMGIYFKSGQAGTPDLERGADMDGGGESARWFTVPACSLPDPLTGA
jgi:hypothetical protein